MLTKRFHQLQTKVAAHVAADRVKQGSYKTCFIGCLANREDSPEFIQREYGIPLAVSRIAEVIFERLPSDEAPAFFAAFPDAIQCNRKDLSRVVWQFLAAELRSLPPVTPEVQAIIDTVATGMDLLAEGKEWPKEDAIATALSARAAGAAGWAASAAGWAASAAEWASSADKIAGWAASAAGRAARAAVNAADGFDARSRQRDLLLKLIKEAPITQQEDQ